MDDEEIAFRRLYGDWAVVTPIDAAELLDGLDAAWWVAGGWTLEAFSGVPREHDDIDVAFFGADLPTVRHADPAAQQRPLPRRAWRRSAGARR